MNRDKTPPKPQLDKVVVVNRTNEELLLDSLKNYSNFITEGVRVGIDWSDTDIKFLNDQHLLAVSYFSEKVFKNSSEKV